MFRRHDVGSLYLPGILIFWKRKAWMATEERLRKAGVLETNGQPGGRTGILIRQSSLLPGPNLTHISRFTKAQDVGC